MSFPPPAAKPTMMRTRYATGSAARQRPPPDAEIDGAGAEPTKALSGAPELIFSFN
jgi:hypothetical protein